MRIILAVSMLTLTVLVTGTTYAGEYEEAVNLIERKKYAVANTLLTAMLAKKDSVRVRYALGFCAEKQNQKAAALKHYKKAIILNTNAGNRVSKDAEKALKRLYVLAPQLFPILQKAWDLESLSHEVKGTEREFRLEAARMLYTYALDDNSWEKAKVAAAKKGPARPMANVHDIEKHLGYRLSHLVRVRDHQDAVRWKNGHYYKFFSDPDGNAGEGKYSWEDAKKKCKELGGYLVIIETQEEWEFILQLLRDDNPAGIAWAGGKYLTQDKAQWLDGSVVDTSIPPRWYESAKKDRYIYVHTNGYLQGPGWGTNTNLGYRIGFICEWE